MRLLNPFEPAPVRPAPAVAPGVAGYGAATAHGPLALALETVSGDVPACAAEAALRLASAEPLLAALDAWLADAGLPAPDWQWQAAPPPAAAAPAGAQARWAGAGVGARLVLPWPLLRQLPAPPSALAVLLQWSPVAAEWLLATLAPGAGEAGLLEPGGVVLLPASFEPGWPVWLRAIGELAPGGLALRLGPGAGGDEAGGEGGERGERGGAGEGAAPRDAAGDAGWEIRAPVAAALPVPTLLGWAAPGGGLPACGPGAEAALWQRQPCGPARRLAHGRLLPWGAGQALRLDAVDAAGTTTTD